MWIRRWRGRVAGVLCAALVAVGVSATPARAVDPTLTFAWADPEQLGVTISITDAPGPYVMFRLYNPVSFYLGDQGYVDSAPVEVVDGAASATVSMLGLARIPKASAVTCAGPEVASCEDTSLVTPIQLFRSEPWLVSMDWQPEIFLNPDLADWSFTLHDSVHAPSVKVVIRRSDYSGPTREIEIADGVTETVDLSDLADGQYRVGLMRCSLVNPAICTSYAYTFNLLILRRQMQPYATSYDFFATPNGDGFADIFRSAVQPDWALPDMEVSWRFLGPDKTPWTGWQTGTLGKQTDTGREVPVDVYAVRSKTVKPGDYWIEFRVRASRSGFDYVSRLVTTTLVPVGQSLKNLSTTSSTFNPSRKPFVPIYLNKDIEMATVSAATLRAIDGQGNVVWTKVRAGRPRQRFEHWDHPSWSGRDSSGRLCKPGRYRLRLTLEEYGGPTKSFTTPSFQLTRD